MTVANQTYKVQAEGNGSATTFSFSPMAVLRAADLQVIITDTAGIETELTEGTGATNYSVSVSSYPGTGSVVYPATGATRLQVDEFITIKRLLTIEQLTDLENQGGYFPDTQETAFDRATMIDLQQQEEIDRVLKVPVSDLTADLTLPTAVSRAGKVLGFDANGLPIAAEGVADVTITPFVATIVDDVDAAAVRNTIGLGDLAVLDTVDGDTIDDNSVTLAELEHGTQGDILYYGASGAPARLGTGTVGQVLQAGGAGANPSWTDAAVAGLPRSYLSGLTLSNGTDATNDIDIAIGTAKAADDSVDLPLTAATGKRLDASWATGGTPGAPTGGLSSSLTISDTTYHVHLVLISGTVEVGFDTSATATNLITDHSATAYRRIGSIIRESGAIVAFIQDGDFFQRAPIYHSGTTATTSTTRTVSGPVGINVILHMNMNGDHSLSDHGTLISDLAMADVAPSASAAPGLTSPGLNRDWVQARVRSNTSSQFRERSTEASRAIEYVLTGWTDTRGRNS